MPRLLTDEEIFRAKGYHPKVKFHADWVHPVDRKIAGAEHAKTRQETAREIKEWGEKECPHVHKVLPNRPKRACDLCWKVFFEDNYLTEGK